MDLYTTDRFGIQEIRGMHLLEVDLCSIDDREHASMHYVVWIE